MVKVKGSHTLSAGVDYQVVSNSLLLKLRDYVMTHSGEGQSELLKEFENLLEPSPRNACQTLHER